MEAARQVLRPPPPVPDFQDGPTAFQSAWRAHRAPAIKCQHRHAPSRRASAVVENLAIGVQVFALITFAGHTQTATLRFGGGDE